MSSRRKGRQIVVAPLGCLTHSDREHWIMSMLVNNSKEEDAIEMIRWSSLSFIVLLEGKFLPGTTMRKDKTRSASSPRSQQLANNLFSLGFFFSRLSCYNLGQKIVYCSSCCRVSMIDSEILIIPVDKIEGKRKHRAREEI